MVPQSVREYVDPSAPAIALRWTSIGSKGRGLTSFLVPAETSWNGIKQFGYPYGIFLDEVGRIYLADAMSMFEGRIVRVNDMTGTGWTNLDMLGSLTGIFVR